MTFSDASSKNAEAEFVSAALDAPHFRRSEDTACRLSRAQSASRDGAGETAEEGGNATQKPAGQVFWASALPEA